MVFAMLLAIQCSTVLRIFEEAEFLGWPLRSKQVLIDRMSHTSPYSDPVVVLVLAISFVFSVVMLHIIGKLARWFYK